MRAFLQFYWALWTVGLVGGGASLAADAAFTVQPVGSWPGYSRGSINAICLRSNLVYAAMRGGGITVIDFGNPSRPRLLGGALAGKNPFDIVLEGSFAYTVCGREGLFIFDVSQASQPRCVGCYPTPDTAMGIRVAKGMAYIADGAAGLLVVDVRNPSAPTLAGRVPAIGETHGVALYGSYACLADHDGALQVVDVHKAEQPVLIAEVKVPAYAVDVVVNGHCAYLSVGDKGLWVYDLRDPSHPALIHTFAADRPAWSPAFFGNELYVDGSGESALERWDVRDPAHPSRRGEFPLHGPQKLLLSEKYGFVLDDNGIQVFRRQALGVGRPLGSYSSGGCTEEVALRGRQAYVADRETGLQVLDLTDPARPRAGARLNRMTKVQALALDGDFLFAGADGNLWIWDISRPAQPRYVSRCPLTPGGSAAGVHALEASQIVVTHRRAFVACDWDFDTLAVIDLRDIKHPRAIAEFDPSLISDEKPVTGSSSCVFLSKHVIDVGNPEKPVLAGRLGDWLMAQRARSTPGYVWVPDLMGTLYIVHLADSGWGIVSHPLGGEYRPRDVAIHEGRAFVADDGGYLHLLDVREPEKPLPVDTVRTTGASTSVTASGDYVYVANGVAGVEIFKVCQGAEAETVRRTRASVIRSGAPNPARRTWEVPAEAARSNEPPTLSVAEQEVVEAFLEDRFGFSTNRIVVEQETAVRFLGTYKPEFSEGPEQEAEQDFIRKNKESVRIVWPKPVSPHLKLLPKRFLRGLFSGKHAKLHTGWDAFYERFPHAPGIIEISRVGIDAQGAVAIMYLGSQSDYLAGQGGMYLLRRKEGQWRIDRMIGPHWVS